MVFNPRKRAPKERSPNVSIYADAKLRDRLKRHASALDLSVSSMIVQVMVDWMDRREAMQPREQDPK